jgi:hypothetical protein
MSINILIEFKKNLIIFIDELIEQLPHEPDLIICRIFLKDQVPIADVIGYFIRKILPLKVYVKKREDKFFLAHNILFGKLDKNKVNHFKRLWSSSALDEEDREVIWKWFDSFIMLSEKYQRCKEDEES